MASAEISVICFPPVIPPNNETLEWTAFNSNEPKDCILPNEVFPLHWEDASAEVLFQACADRIDSRAWEEFVRRYGALIERTAYRTAQSYSHDARALLSDLIQEFYVRLFADNARALRIFKPTRPDSEFGYLKVITAHAVLDYFRRNKNEKLNIPLEKAPEPETSGADPNRELLLQEIERCLERTTDGTTQERDRTVFRLYYAQGLTAKAISQIPCVGLSCEGVESLLGRLRQAVRDCLRLRQQPEAGEAA